jgi:2-oxoglutarate ferredoxin oxidoreductase subunit gamma
MEHKLIAAGFGGQGVMLFGQLVAQAGMLEGKNVTWLPSYGPEMRGGTANCTVVVSDEPVASPVVDTPNEIAIFNIPSLLKFEPMLEQGGVLVMNTSIIDREPSRKDITVIKIPANEIAEKLGTMKAQNMVMLGAYIEATKAVNVESIFKALEKKMSGKKAQFLDVNKKAIEEGMKIAREQLK